MRLEPVRYEWIDVLKGLGIILVVVGHTLPSGSTPGIYVFHMPLFFLLSGFLHKPTVDHRQFLQKKIISLLIPYVAFLFLIYAPYAFLEHHKGKLSIGEAITAFIAGGRLLIGWAGAFWFITTLFFVQLLFNWLVVHFPLRKVILLVAGLYIIGSINDTFFPQFWLPWNADITLVAIAFYLLGFLFSKYPLPADPRLLISSLLILLFTQIHPAIALDMKFGQYGIVLVTLFAVIVIILALAFVARVAVNRKWWLVQQLQSIGKASLTIMYLHQCIQMSFVGYLGISSPIIRIIAAIAIGYIAHSCFLKFRYTRALLLGNYKDFRSLTSRKRSSLDKNANLHSVKQ